jgi:hypothetical protein
MLLAYTMAQEIFLESNLSDLDFIKDEMEDNETGRGSLLGAFTLLDQDNTVETASSSLPQIPTSL